MNKKTVNTDTGEIIESVPENQWPHNRLHVKHQYNAFQFPAYRESNNQPSKTVPNQTLSLKTLLDRYGRGLPLSGNPSEPQYFQDNLMPDINKMDISEIHDLKNAIKSDIQKKQQELQDQQTAAKQAAHEKTIDAEVEKRLNARTKPDDSKAK